MEFVQLVIETDKFPTLEEAEEFIQNNAKLLIYRELIILPCYTVENEASIQ